MTDCERKFKDIKDTVNDFVIGNLFLVGNITNPNVDKEELIKLLLDSVNRLKDDIKYIVEGD